MDDEHYFGSASTGSARIRDDGEDGVGQVEVHIHTPGGYRVDMNEAVSRMARAAVRRAMHSVGLTYVEESPRVDD